jgi:hypothetical protein
MRRAIDETRFMCRKRIESAQLRTTDGSSLLSSSASTSTTLSCIYPCDLVHPSVLACTPLPYTAADPYNATLPSNPVDSLGRPICASSISVTNAFPTLSTPSDIGMDAVVPIFGLVLNPPVLSQPPLKPHVVSPSVQCEAHIPSVMPLPTKVAFFHHNTKSRPARNRVFVTRKTKYGLVLTQTRGLTMLKRTGLHL